MSALPPPPVDLTFSSLRALTVEQLELPGIEPTAAKTQQRAKSASRMLLGFLALCAVGAGVLVWRKGLLARR